MPQRKVESGHSAAMLLLLDSEACIGTRGGGTALGDQIQVLESTYRGYKIENVGRGSEEGQGERCPGEKRTKMHHDGVLVVRKNGYFVG